MSIWFEKNARWLFNIEVKNLLRLLFHGVWCHFQQYFSQFYWRRKPGDPEKTTDLSQVTDKLYHIMVYTSPWSRFELTTPVVISTDSTGSCKSNYHIYDHGYDYCTMFHHLYSFLCCPIMCLYAPSSVLWCSVRFPYTNDVLFIFTSSGL